MDPLGELERDSRRRPAQRPTAQDALAELGSRKQVPTFLAQALGSPGGQLLVGMAVHALGAKLGVDVAASLRAGVVVYLPSEKPKRRKGRRS